MDKIELGLDQGVLKDRRFKQAASAGVEFMVYAVCLVTIIRATTTSE